jgi:hypothetical protein
MVKFKEKDHIYEDINDGSKWTSVTTFLHMFEPEKDWDKIAATYAKKNNLKIEEVKEKWASENFKAIQRGTLFHKKREEELLYCESINNLPIYRPVIEDEIKIATSQKLGPGIYPELLVTLSSAKLCGQADYVEIDEDYNLTIKDYKTNKEIKRKGFVNWEGIEECLTGPLNNIPNSNYWLYALQLNTYAYIIKRNNPKIKIKKLELLHIIFDEDEVKEVVTYELPDLQKDVKRAIEYFKVTK